MQGEIGRGRYTEEDAPSPERAGADEGGAMPSIVSRPPGRRPVARAVATGVGVLALLVVGQSALADGHLASERSGDANPPPRVLSPEGMVPAEGARASGASPAPETIGHVPGPAEGVYGDPPNTGGVRDPERRGWAYDTDYFFALTRGLKDDTDLGKVAIRWIRPLTITFDVATLPTAALAGLAGRAPADSELPPEDEAEVEAAAAPTANEKSAPAA
jgi:hypothetical protein